MLLYNILNSSPALVDAFLESIASWIGGFILMFAGWALGLSGFLLEATLKFTIVEMSTIVNNLPALTTAWEAFRDLANIFFIFLILYIAISTILQIDTPTIKRLLVHLIIVALLLNFSLFFTKVTIDVSNIVTNHFYQSISQSGGTTANGDSLGLAGAFMQKLGLQNFANPGGAATVLNDNINGPINILLVGLLSGFLFLVVAFVFGAMAIMLIARFVILVFLMILSPLAFIAMALPKNEYVQKWLKPLFNQLIFAPAMLAFIWVTLIVLGGLFPSGETNIGGSLVELIPNDNPGFSGLLEEKIKIILNFMIVIGMAIFSLIAAKQIGAYGAQGAINRGKRWVKGASAYTGGVVARGAIRRSGLRKAYEKAGESGFFQKVGTKTRTGRLINRIGLGTLPHDVMEGTLGRVVKKKIGGTSALESYEQIERLKTVRQSIDRVNEMKKQLKEAKEDKMEAKKEVDKKKRDKMLAEADAKIAEANARIPTQAFVSSLSKKDLLDEDIIKNATDSQYQELMKSDRLTYDEKTQATKARYGWIEKEVDRLERATEEYNTYKREKRAYDLAVKKHEKDPNVTVPDKPKEVSQPEMSKDVKSKLKRNTSIAELEHINERMPELLNKSAFWSGLKSSTANELRRSDKLSTQKKDKIRALKYNEFVQLGKERPSDDLDELELQRDEMRENFKGKSVEELVRAPGSTVKFQPLFMDVISKRVLRGFEKEDEGDKAKLIKHMLEMEQQGRASQENKEALAWLASGSKEATDFYSLKDAEAELREEFANNNKNWREVDRSSYQTYGKEKIRINLEPKQEPEPQKNTKPENN